MARSLIQNVRIVDGGSITDGCILVEDGRIEAILPCGAAAADAQPIDGGGLYASAGFIDLHVHGGAGHDFMDGTMDAFRASCDQHLAHGVTTMLPTLSTGPEPLFRRAIDNLRIARGERAQLQCLPGVHIEGQYIAEERSGGMDGRNIRTPNPAEYIPLIDYADGDIARWSIAPELPGGFAFGDYCTARGIVLSVAHSNATYAEVREAMGHGFCHLTHFYSDMNTVTRKNGFRVMGAIEAGYDLPGLWIEVISDGCHLPPELLGYIYRHIGAERMHLVSDCIRAAGLEGPIVDVGEAGRQLQGILEDGVVKFLDRSAFHGSIAQGDMLVRAAHCAAGIPLTDCIRMMAENPAKILGLSGKGRLLPGYDADIVLFDEQVRARSVYYRGRLVVTANESKGENQ